MATRWELYVREHLGDLRLDPARQAGIVQELAQQLEQAAAEGRDPEAEIPDWRALARKLEHAAASPPARFALAADALHDLRYTLRGWWRTPGFAVIALLTLALGIGANTAMFSWVNAELLRALPYTQPAQLLVLNEWADGREVSVSYPDYLDWQHDNQTQHGHFSSLAWVQWYHYDISGAGAPEVAASADVSRNYFTTLGVLPALGRGFSPGADGGGAKHEAVITWALAERQFGIAGRAVGRTLDLDQAAAYTVVGVLPPQFRESEQTDLFVPDGLQLKKNAARADRSDSAVIGRLVPGASFAAAAAQMRAEMARLAAAYPDDQGVGSIVAPLRSAFVGSDAAMLWLLFGAVGLVLLLACANVANLTLTRTATRRQEWSVRTALGAGRARMLRQLLLEGLALGVAGAGLGLLIAEAGMRGLAALMPVAANEVVPLGLSWPVLAFTAAAALAAVVLFGLGPALAAARQPWNSRGAAGASWRRRRELLLVAEVALALMLTAGAGLLLQSFAKLVAVNPGFQPASVLTLSRRLAGPRYASPTAVLQFEQQALAKLSALPGVQAAGLGTNLPLTGDHGRSDISIVGRPTPQRGHYPHPDFHYISSGYLPALGLPLLAGRNLGSSDRQDAPAVVLVSQSFAQTYWPQARDALGRQLCCASQGRHITIVGIVGNTRQYGLDAPERMEVYVPFTQFPPQHPTFVLRTQVPPLSLAAPASAAFHDLDPALPVPEVQTMSQVVSASLGQPQAMLWLLGIFGGLALLLAAIGIYGVVSYATQQRTAEIGIRLALGANHMSVAWLIAGACLKLAVIGIVLGWAGVLLSSHWLQSHLFGVTVLNPAVLAAVSALLLAVAALACAAPIRRATRVDPMAALRQE